MKKTAMITGAGSGIGRAVALAFLRAGYCVTLAGRRADPLKETLALAQVDPTAALVVPTDVSRPEAGAGAVRRRRSRRSGASICCSTTPAAERRRCRSTNSPLRQWRSVVDVNLTGVFLCMQQAFRVMKAQKPRGGRIINNGSISAHAPRPNSAPYTATKHAVTGLTKAAVTRRPRIRHRRRADRHRQRCHADDRAHAPGRAAAQRRARRRTGDGRAGRSADAVLHMAGLSARRERPVHDRHGHQDAVCRSRLIHAPFFFSWVSLRCVRSSMRPLCRLATSSARSASSA